MKYAREGAKVKVSTGNVTVSAEDNGAIYANTGAGAAKTYSLPAAVAGLNYLFCVNAAQELRIDPNGSETIGLPSTGAQGAAGKYLTADAVGEWVKIICIETGKWYVVGYAGTWTAEA